MDKTSQIAIGIVLLLVLGYLLPVSGTSHAHNERSITILNPQSYPVVGGNWTINFNTTGSGTLKINNHSFPEEVGFVALYKKERNLWIQVDVDIDTDYDIITADWSYSEGKAVFRVKNPGKHVLEFDFGGDVQYAHNFAAGDHWWNESWKYRMLINITENTGSQLTHYQVPITLNTTTFNYSKADSSGDDLRFTLYNKTTGAEQEIPYFIESWSTSSESEIWVNVSEILASSTAMVYMYYGNLAASSGSDKDSAFIFWDDFETDKGWTYEETTVDVAGSYDSTEYNSSTTSYEIENPSGSSVSTGDYGQIYKDFMLSDTGDLNISVYNKGFNDGGSSGEVYMRVLVNSTQISSVNLPAGGGTIDWTRRSGTYTPSSTNIRVILRLYYNLASSNLGPRHVFWDDLLIRKYASTEPTVNLVGEESQTHWIDYFGGTGGIDSSTNVTVSEGDVELTTSSTDLQVPTSCGDSSYGSGESYEWYSRWTPPGSGTVFVNKLWFWDGDGSVSSGETIYMAMYNDGGGYNKITGSDASLTGTGSTGWISADVGTPFEITLGTDYWIGVTGASGTAYTIYRDSSANCANYPPNGIGSYYQSNNNALDASVPTGESQSSNKYIIPAISYTVLFSGNITSIPITPQNLSSWDKFYANDTTPAGTSITYKILDENNNSITDVTSGQDISSISDSTIRLFANFSTTNLSLTPTLHDWNVTWSPLVPPSGGVTWFDQNQSVDTVKKGESIELRTRWQDPVELGNATLQRDIGAWQNVSNRSLSGTEDWSNFTLSSELLGWEPGNISWRINADNTTVGWNVTDEMTFELWGWSNISLTAPDGGTYLQGKNDLTLTALVYDVNNSTAISNYSVRFFYTLNGSTTYIGQNLTNSTGHATWNWDMSDLQMGIYTVKANITDNASLYYNASSDNEDSTQITLAGATCIDETIINGTSVTGDHNFLHVNDEGNTREISEEFSTSGTTTYNYVGVTQSTNDHYAYECDVDSWSSTPTGSNLNSKNEALDGDYANIATSNNGRWSTIDPGWGDEAFLWLDMEIDEDPSIITNIDLTFEGYSDGGSATFRMWVYDDTAGTWGALGSDQSMPSGSDGTMTRSITSNFDDYISGTGMLTWGMSSDDASERMRIDYVNAEITYQTAASVEVNYTFNFTEVDESKVTQIDFITDAWSQETTSIYVWNYDTSSWIDTGNDTASSETLKTITLVTGDCTSYIEDGTGNITIKYDDDVITDSTLESLYIDYHAINVTWVPPTGAYFWDQNQSVFVVNRGDSIVLSTRWTDPSGLQNATLQRYLGGWQNISTLPLSGTEDWSNFTLSSELLNWDPGNISWRIFGNSTTGIFNYTDVMTFELWGWSNVTWNLPTDGSNYIQGTEIPLKCQVKDVNNSSGLANYTVNFYWWNATTSNTSLGSNITNSTGYAIINWDTTGLSVGAYYPKCNITDNETSFYNVTFEDEANISVIIISDTEAPKFYTPGLNDNNVSWADSVELWINITDDSSVNSSKFKIMYPNGTDYNFSASLKNGTSQSGFWNFTFDTTLGPPGTYNWTYAYANDTVDNQNSTTIELKFNVSDLSPPIMGTPSYTNPLELGNEQNITITIADASFLPYVNISIEDLDGGVNKTMNGTKPNFWYAYMPSATNQTVNFTIYAIDDLGYQNSTSGSYTVGLIRNIILNSGYSLISLPVDEKTLYAGSFGSSISNVTKVTMLNRTTKYYKSCINISGVGWIGDNFTMEPGYGYWVNGSTSEESMRIGDPIGSITSNLTSGWNLIGLKANATASATATDIGPNCTDIVGNWNGTAYEGSYIVGVGGDFNMEIGRGYWAWVSNNTTWIY